jgi:hypothetical protein
MTLTEFAERYKVKIRKDSCDDPIVAGRVKWAKHLEDNHNVFEADGEFYVYFNFLTVGKWNNVRKKLIEKGAKPYITCEVDGYLSFDPENAELVKLILRLAKIRTKRQLTPEQKAAVRARFTKT